MDDHGKKIQKRSGVDIKPSESRAVMGHCAAQTQIVCSFYSLKKETD